MGSVAILPSISTINMLPAELRVIVGLFLLVFILISFVWIFKPIKFKKKPKKNKELENYLDTAERILKKMERN